MGKSAIPDRWLNYIPVGKPVEGTRFIAFKVPLRQEILQKVDNVNTRLDIDKLLKIVPNLGLIIDLTNTDRYYNPRQFIENGVQHIKLCVPGHQVPEKHLRARFCKYVKMFLEDNKHNDKLIGVHCTHGVNRSGFLICDHMINEDNFDPKEAVERFASARGHPIERQNYISALLINKILECKNDKKEVTITTKPEEELPQYTYLPLKVERSTESYYIKPRDNERFSSKEDIHKHRSLRLERNRFDPRNTIESSFNKGYRDRYESQRNPRNHVEYCSSSATTSYERFPPIRKNSNNFTEISRRFTPEDRDDAHQKITNYSTTSTANNWTNYEERSLKQDNCYNSSTNNLLNTYHGNRNQYKWERKDEQQTTAARRPREDDHYLRRPEIVQSRPRPYHQSERPNYRNMEEPPTFRGTIRERLPYAKRKI